MIEKLPNGLKFDVRKGTNDHDIIWACCVEDEYRLAAYLKPGKLVFDIGAHVGGVAVWAASRGCTVVALEALQENAEALVRNAGLNGVGMTVAVGAMGTDTVSFDYEKNGYDQPQVHRFIGNLVGSGGHTERVVTQYKLGELVEKYGTPDILKIDCEGGEWAALADPYIYGIPRIVGEWHGGPEGQPGIGAIDPLLGHYSITRTNGDDSCGNFIAERL